jgi:hypothetical protein
VAFVVILVGGVAAGYLVRGAGTTISTSYYTTTLTPTTTLSGIGSTAIFTTTATVLSTETSTIVSKSGQLGPWNKTSVYPAPNAPSSCIISGAYMYCAGGNGQATYFAPTSSNGTGQWKRGADYPIPIQGESCVDDTNIIFCIGGVSNGPGNQTTDKFGRTASAYYSSRSGTLFGQWTKTTSYPYVAASPRCVASSSFVYCIEDAFNGTVYTGVPLAYFAPLSASGIGRWVQTTAPPSITAGCSVVGGYEYCFGGGQCQPHGGDCYSPSYSAPLSSNGIGTWKRAADIPTAGFANVIAADSNIYYLAVPIFYAGVSAGIIGTWETTTNFPDPSSPGPCASDGAYLFCTSYHNNSTVYYSRIGAPNPGALVLQNPPPFPRAAYLLPAWYGSGGCGVSVNGTFAGAPCFGANINDAVVFNCATEAATATGCKTSVVSPTNTKYNYDVTIWYPKYNSSMPNSNCALQPSFGYDKPFHVWCISITQNAFIVAQQIQMEPAR